MADIEAMAEAAFTWLHTANSRRRNWADHPEEDNGAELGRNTFRGMAGAMLAVDAPPADAPPAAPEPIYGADTSWGVPTTQAPAQAAPAEPVAAKEA
jgi:hypothetical protein